MKLILLAISMEDFAKNCNDIKPNITYLAIGCAYSDQGGLQQHPPFLSDLIARHPEFSYQIILVDPWLEDTPEIASTYNLKKIDDNWYGRDNINVHAIRECFEFDKVLVQNHAISRNFLFELINRTIRAKHQAPGNTYLFFMHDFSAYHISEFADKVYAFYQKFNEILYRKNILIDLNSKLDPACFPDMNKFYFHPKLIKSSNGSLEIFNPFLLDDFDIYTIVLQNYHDGIYKLLISHVLNYRLDEFARNVLRVYRQVRTILDNKGEVSLEIEEIPSVLLEGLDIIEVYTALYVKCDESGLIVLQMTENMLGQLHLIMAFMDFFQTSQDLWDEIFSEFVNECKKKVLDNPYQLTTIFSASQKKLKNFVLTAKPDAYLEELENQTVQYTIKNHRMPLYIQLYKQDPTLSIVIDI